MSSMDYILASNWLMQNDNNNNTNTPTVKNEPPTENGDSSRDMMNFGRKLVEQQHEDQQPEDGEEDNNDGNTAGLQIFGGDGGDVHDKDGDDDDDGKKEEEKDEEDSSEDEEDMDTENTTKQEGEEPMEDDDDEEEEASSGQWIPMLDYLCSVNGGCSLKELQVLFTNLESRRWMLDQLRQSRIVATHLKTAAAAAGSEQQPQQHLLDVRCDDLTAQNANVVYAFRGYLSITVRQYYFARHGVVLRHPYLPCLIEYGGVVRRSMSSSSCSPHGVGLRFERHASFFPLEVLAVFVPSSQQQQQQQLTCSANGNSGSKHTILPSQRGLYK